MSTYISGHLFFTYIALVKGCVGWTVTVYRWVYKRFGNAPDLLASEHCELVVEGFPRSANTYFLYAFETAQSNGVIVKGHSHSSGNVRLSVWLNKPTCILIRSPRDAIISHLIRNPDASEKRLLQSYEAFYTNVARVRDNVVIAEFNDITSNINAVIVRINSKFNTRFDLLVQSEANMARIEEKLSQRNGVRGWRFSYLPNENKRAMKEDIVLKQHKLLDKCDLLYADLASSMATGS